MTSGYPGIAVYLYYSSRLVNFPIVRPWHEPVGGADGDRWQNGEEFKLLKGLSVLEIQERLLGLKLSKRDRRVLKSFKLGREGLEEPERLDVGRAVKLSRKVCDIVGGVEWLRG